MAACSAFLSPQGTIESLGSWKEGDPMGWQYSNIPQTKPNVLLFVLSHTLNLPDLMHCLHFYLPGKYTIGLSQSQAPPTIAILILRVHKCS